MTSLSLWWFADTFSSWLTRPREDLCLIFQQGTVYQRVDIKWSTRLDIIWDHYRELTTKGGTREKQGTGTRQRVKGMAKIQRDWQKFLAHVDNKEKRFSFLSNKLLTDGQGCLHHCSWSSPPRWQPTNGLKHLCLATSPLVISITSGLWM